MGSASRQGRQLEPGRGLANLDQALLFISALIVSLFALVLPHTNIPGEYYLTSLAVFVTISTILPIYAGYMKGAVESDSVFDRARGWVYLIFGTGSFVLSIAVDAVPIAAPSLIALGLIAITGTVLFILGMLGLFIGTLRFTGWIYARVARRTIP